jgi:hypothetical protein
VVIRATSGCPPYSLHPDRIHDVLEPACVVVQPFGERGHPCCLTVHLAAVSVRAAVVGVVRPVQPCSTGSADITLIRAKMCL